MADCERGAGRRRHGAARGGEAGGGPAIDRGPWAPVISGWLGEERHLPSLELLRRSQEQGYTGGKSAIYELIRRLRPVEVVPLVRFEGVPGKFSQHDFGQVDVRYRAGGGERIRFFASRLKWSRFVHVILGPDEREETLIRGLLA